MTTDTVEVRSDPIGEATKAWGVVSALCMAGGYAYYIYLTLAEGVTPNATSWSLWAFGGIAEAWSFWTLIRATSGTHKGRDIALAVPSIICAVFACVIAGIGIGFGKFAWPEPWEWFIAAVDVSVVLIYLILDAISKEQGFAAKWANRLMVVDIALSFVPIWVSTWERPEGENIIPWVIWTFSYLLIAAMASIQIDKPIRQRGWLMTYPVMSAFFHAAIPVILFIRGIQ